MAAAKPVEQNPYELVNDPTLHRMLAVSFGDYGAGKTHFWLTAPGPIYIQSFDRGLEGLVERFQGTKQIFRREYSFDKGVTTQDAAQRIRDQFIKDYEYALKHARTILWDKETDWWACVRYAEFGGNKEQAKNYEPINNLYRELLNRPKSIPYLNFGVIQSIKERWGKIGTSGQGKPQYGYTGDFEPYGFGETHGLMMTEIRHRREPGGSDADGKPLGPSFFMDIGKCRQNTDIQDQSFPAMTFAEFGSQVLFPGSPEEDWE